MDNYIYAGLLTFTGSFGLIMYFVYSGYLSQIIAGLSIGEILRIMIFELRKEDQE